MYEFLFEACILRCLNYIWKKSLRFYDPILFCIFRVVLKMCFWQPWLYLLKNWICTLLNMIDLISFDGWMNVVKLLWLNRFWFLFQLESIRIRFCVMLFLCMLAIYCQGYLDNLIRRTSIMDLKIGILLRMIKGYTHLYHSHLNRLIKTN